MRQSPDGRTAFRGARPSQPAPRSFRGFRGSNKPREPSAPVPVAGEGADSLDPIPLPPRRHLEFNILTENTLNPPPKIGGRLSSLYPVWEDITDDSFVLSVLRDVYRFSVLESFPGVLR